jgi:sugar phosphate isomerase/epimerase
MSNNIDRRSFIQRNIIATTGLAFIPQIIKAGRNWRGAQGTGHRENSNQLLNPVRLGGPVAGKLSDPAEWIKAVKSLGYTAAYSPLQPGAGSELIKSYRKEAEKNNIIIAEVGVWNNPANPDEDARKDALKKNVEAMQFADEIGACCCVNISGARGEIWDGPYPGNYSTDTFDLIVENVRYIIDQVKPLSSFYTLEPMPYMLPDSPDSYLELIKAVNRKQFAVHLDPVNMISSPDRYYKNAAFLKECFSKLGPYIKSIHAKDILIMPELTLHLEERRPGLGTLDYDVFLREAAKLKDIPFMLEHLSNMEDYRLAASYVREVANNSGIKILQQGTINP